MTTIHRLLVANRGEIAVRIFRTARDLGMSTVAVHSDADAGLPFVSAADIAVRLAGNSSSVTYLNAEALIAAARSAGADAIHPGYGFLSENAAFARACAGAGITFIGPPPEAIEAMGSKLAAKQLMASHGVPVLPGGIVGDASDVRALASELGWPLLLKAAFGGGGRGMRALPGPEGLEGIVESTRREAESAFGDGTLFAERLLVAPRHIEVQVMADSHGTVVPLFERECSIQRRYQKVIEECPSPAVGAELRAALGDAAVSAARAIGYRGAGTVEFVVEEGGGFFFLEVNTRLQVEHPVTEAVTGLDLVALQLLVAEGGALPPEVLGAQMHGHAIEARLYAEDVGAGFLPAAGRLSRFEIDAADGIRVDTGVASGSTVSPYYDAMLAKVIAWAPTRREAARRLGSVLERARLHGVTTNRDLLVSVLRHPEFLAGRTDTAFFERNDPVLLSEEGGSPGPARERTAVHCAAAAFAGQAARRAAAAVQPHVPSGWRNVRDLPQRVHYRHAGEELTVSYEAGRPGGAGAGRAWVTSRAEQCSPEPGAGDVVVEVAAATAESVQVVLGDRRLRVAVHADGEAIYLDSPLGHSSLEEVPRFVPPGALMAEGSLLSPMPGAVTRVLATAGDVVAKGAVVLILEAMKMEHPVRSPRDGTVQEICVSAGDQVAAGAVLAVIGSTIDPVEQAPPAQLPSSGRPE